MKSLLAKYFISYLAIGLLPILLGFISYYTNIVAGRQEVEESNLAALTQTVSELDYMAVGMKNIAYHFSAYLEDSEVFNADSIRYADGNILAQRIKSYEESLGFPVDIILFLRGDTQLYTAGGVLHYMEFETAVRNAGDLTMSAFYTTINRVENNVSFRLSHDISAGKNTPANIMYLFPVPYLNIYSEGVVCFMLKSESVKSIFENYMGDIKGNMYIYNELYQNLYALENLALPENFTKNLGSLKGIGVQERKIGGVTYFFMRRVSENTGLSCISIMKKDDFFSRIIPMQRVLLVSLVLLVLACFLAAMVLARRNYKPIRRLLANMGDASWEYKKSGSNEFDFILDKWNTIEETNLALNHTLDIQRPMVAYSCLHRLLKGEYADREELDYYLKCANININAPYFFVLLVTPAVYAAEYGSVSSRIQHILSAVNENSSMNCKLYSIELILEQQVAVIGNAEAVVSDAGGEDIRFFMAKFLVNRIAAVSGFPVKIAAGRIQDSPLKINISFLEAVVVMADYLAGKRQIVSFEEATEAGREQYQYPVIEQAMYIQSIKQGNKEMALKAVDEIVAGIDQAEASPVTQCLCFDIINMMIKVSGQLGSQMTKADIKALSGFANLEAFRLKARELTEGLCDKFAEMREHKNSRLKSEIINHIDENFCSTQFGLQQVADRFEISPNYLSRFLKQETGYTFIEYVSMLRMDRVKHLLVTTDKKVKEIVSDVGYMDTASFLRKFKAAEGITPGQFREKMRN